MSTSECPRCGEPVTDVYQWNWGVEPFTFDGNACFYVAAIKQGKHGHYPELTIYVHEERQKPTFDSGYGHDPL